MGKMGKTENRLWLAEHRWEGYPTSDNAWSHDAKKDLNLNPLLPIPMYLGPRTPLSVSIWQARFP